MRPAYMNGTKNMWVQRCSHIGALFGGILSVLLGWIPPLFRAVWKEKWNLFPSVIALAVVSGVGCLMFDISRSGDLASGEYLKSELARSGRYRACLQTSIEQHLTKIALYRRDISTFLYRCEDLEDKRKALIEQEQVIVNQRQSVK